MLDKNKIKKKQNNEFFDMKVALVKIDIRRAMEEERDHSDEKVFKFIKLFKSGILRE